MIHAPKNSTTVSIPPTPSAFDTRSNSRLIPDRQNDAWPGENNTANEFRFVDDDAFRGHSLANVDIYSQSETVATRGIGDETGANQTNVPGAGTGPPPAPGDKIPVYIRADNTATPAYGPCGRFYWPIQWVTSGRSGHIIQEIRDDFVGEYCTGEEAGLLRPSHYFEAWAVDAFGNVTPTVPPPAPAGTNDVWDHPGAPQTRGRWSINGFVYWSRTLHPSFAINPRARSRSLPSTTSRPPDLGFPVLPRIASGSWDCCVEPPFHDPIAMPQ